MHILLQQQHDQQQKHLQQ